MISILENLIFRNRRLVVVLFILLTIFMAYQASHLKIDAGFAKMLPLKHPYMQTYLEYRDAFGGANRVVIAIKARDGDIFTPHFFEVLAEVTDEVFFNGDGGLKLLMTKQYAVGDFSSDLRFPAPPWAHDFMAWPFQTGGPAAGNTGFSNFKPHSSTFRSAIFFP